MRTTKTGIELPEKTDYVGTTQNALGTLWCVCCQMADVIDKMHDDIKECKKNISEINNRCKEHCEDGIENKD